GRLSLQGAFAAGRRSGEWVQSDDRGVTREVTHYLEGAMHGDRRFYDEKGKLLRTQTYEHGFHSKGTIPADLARRAAHGDTASLRRMLRSAAAPKRDTGEGASPRQG